MGRRDTFSVPQGPIAYAKRVRRLGWLMALVIPGLLLLGTVVAKSKLSCQAGVVCKWSFATNWAMPGMALPTAILWGVPIFGGRSRTIGVFASSAVLWALLGLWASRRATKRPIASWRTWFREYAFLLLGVWLGVLAGLVALAALVGNSTFSNLI